MILPSRILFIGAHCDDVELFAGGLLARACASGRKVGILVFSDHRGIVSDELAARARSEMRANLDWVERELGTRVEDHCGEMMAACRGVFQSERATLYAAMEAVRDDYDLVVTHALTDTNQDHRQVAEEAARVFKAHASLLSGEFPNNDLGEFQPQVYVGLSPRELEAKVSLVGRYRSQDFGGRPYFDESMIRALARVRGAQIREPAAEAFAVLGRVVLRESEAS